MVEAFNLDHPYLLLKGFLRLEVPDYVIEEILGALHEMLSRFEGRTTLRELWIDFPDVEHTTGWVIALQASESTPPTTIAFSLRDIIDFTAATARGEEKPKFSKWGDRPFRYIAIHEFIHAVDATEHLSALLRQVLHDTWARLIQLGLISEPEHTWLARLPASAFKDRAKTELDDVEALAEGFAETEVHGAPVGSPHWSIHQFVGTGRPPQIMPDLIVDLESAGVPPVDLHSAPEVPVSMTDADASVRFRDTVDQSSATRSHNPSPPALSRSAYATEVRQVTPQDCGWRRDLSLQMLLESPESFKSSYEEAAARTEQHWRSRIAASPNMLAALRAGKPVGTINVAPVENRPDAMEITGVWVAPTARGTGVGDQLMRRQLQWLRDNHYREAILWRLESNTAMERLARRHGFTHTGRRQNDAGYPEPIIEMSRDLD
ncbi:GNAT family N-acetyltransferase [Nocardia wallacei]|uniref:GNAT family N-acetyltransferase n=1 Tax=Nocardia wallacei TaxID=480035 RepID=UPI002456E71B|nr:GNAT family N-acetyltransferase [Nocardia wallacei]